jgi:hypothetical protein
MTIVGCLGCWRDSGHGCHGDYVENAVQKMEVQKNGRLPPPPGVLGPTGVSKKGESGVVLPHKILWEIFTSGALS